MFGFSGVSLAHRAAFERFLKDEAARALKGEYGEHARAPIQGDINFTNCYMWSEARFIGVREFGDCLVILTKAQDEKPFIFYPIGGSVESKMATLREVRKLLGGSVNLKCLMRWQKDEIAREFGLAETDFVSNRDRADYIYDVNELITLNGRKFHPKKNMLNRFLEEFWGFEYETISASNIAEIKAAADAWLDMLVEQTPGLVAENVAIKRALDAFGALGLKGGAIRYMGEIIAFSFGEVLESGAALIHIEKADLSKRGAYQAINQQLLAHEFSACALANREEDLGIEGLRKAKLSYNPVELLEKFETTL